MGILLLLIYWCCELLLFVIVYVPSLWIDAVEILSDHRVEFVEKEKVVALLCNYP